MCGQAGGLGWTCQLAIGTAACALFMPAACGLRRRGRRGRRPVPLPLPLRGKGSEWDTHCICAHPWVHRSCSPFIGQTHEMEWQGE